MAGAKLSNRRTTMSEINVTPLVDVMLVLLIIFMVTAPLMQQGMDVNLPAAKGKDLPPEKRLTVTINKRGNIFLNKEKLTPAELGARLEAIGKTRTPDVFLRADRDVPYGLVVKVMSAIKEAGVEKLGMITDPASPEK